MAKGRPGPPARQRSTPAKPIGRRPRLDIVHTSVYLQQATYEALRRIAFDERCRIHDLMIEGIGLALKKRGYSTNS
jgi:hypothetical protein